MADSVPQSQAISMNDGLALQCQQYAITHRAQFPEHITIPHPQHAPALRLQHCRAVLVIGHISSVTVCRPVHLNDQLALPAGEVSDVDAYGQLTDELVAAQPPCVQLFLQPDFCCGFIMAEVARVDEDAGDVQGHVGETENRGRIRRGIFAGSLIRPSATFSRTKRGRRRSFSPLPLFARERVREAGVRDHLHKSYPRTIDIVLFMFYVHP